ncbi:MAG TPA: SAM-dependent methyltransferase [Lamprocystis sp. (in: g-proteobacteria)]|nr:SAM-dependent methyltransferase [Lamprocystis sp. (in: g-proteobacteria)]
MTLHPPASPIVPTDDDAATRHTERLTALIREEISAAGGLLPFDRFMDLALYAPGLGYYVAGAAKLGADGDFVTAPELSPLFGACVAAQCAEALQRLNGGDLLEFGAGSGALAVAVLTGLERLNALPGRYLILEPSPDLQARQRDRLRAQVPHLAGRCRWLTALPSELRGVVLANEVLDAMPVHRFRIGPQGVPLEVFVADTDGVLSEVTAPIRSAGLAAAVAALQAKGLARTPGYCSEVNLRLAPWVGALSHCLAAGLVLLIDYGNPVAAYYQPDRTMGTLMCHLRQQAHGDPFSHIGLQDITADVDFSDAAQAARAVGLTLAGFSTQAQFLIGCGIDQWLAAAAGSAQPTLDLVQAVKQLMLPSAMGERFKVLGLSRGVAGPWRGFSTRDLRDRL